MVVKKIDKPKVSIIVPVYGVEEYLDKCIQSIMAQSVDCWELILIDDGSPDNSGKICDSYAAKDARIRVIHTPNKGVSHARNVGLASAQGRYITFIDSDDWVEPGYLANLLRYADDDKTVIYGNVINDYSGPRESDISFNYTNGEIINVSEEPKKIVEFRILENGFPIAKLFVAKITQDNNLRFDESISYHEDHLFVLSYLLCCDTITLSHNADYHYVHRSGSLSKRKHSAQKMMTASTKLIGVVGKVIERFGITDEKDVKRLYTLLGLNQLMLALKNADSSELNEVAATIRCQYQLFRRYYSPNHKLFRIAPLLFKFHIEKLYKPILQWKERGI